MLPDSLRALFWDLNLETFDPLQHSEYAIARILELGDEAAVVWMRETFEEARIVEVIRRDRRLSRRSANYWRLVYRIPAEEVAALAG
jgi:hypothetical protein